MEILSFNPIHLLQILSFSFPRLSLSLSLHGFQPSPPPAPPTDPPSPPQKARNLDPLRPHPLSPPPLLPLPPPHQPNPLSRSPPPNPHLLQLFFFFFFLLLVLPQNHQNPRPTTRRRCDYSDGRWLRDDRAPLYTGMSCATIKSNQNCMANGRPDSGYLHWRWQPSQCDLPRFDPSSFLSQIRNKHLAFVGDSMARNQLESLLCLLATASSPALVYRDGEDNKFRRWSFQSHNATVSVFWSPFLVKAIEKSEELGVKHNRVYLDSFDERWTSELDHIDIVIFSFGHWFLNPGIYHENNLTLGCHYCPEFNYTEIGFFGVFRKALKNVLNEVRRQSGPRSEKLVAVTTFSPAHFDGEWDKLGACPNKEPYKEGDKEVEYMDKEMRRIAVEEVAIAANEVGRNGVRFEAVDVTKLATMRADGHPGPYMYKDPFAAGVKDRVQNDCVHWCLPGPIDTFNQILLHLIKR